MKKTNTSIWHLVTIIFFGFSSFINAQSLEMAKNIDPRLVGTWAGSEKDQQIEGVSKEWEMTRKKDGTFVLDFKAISQDEVEEFTEEGTWWTDKNNFYEYHENSDKTDSYTFEVLNDNEIKFEMTSSEVDFNEPNYTFVDKRKTPNTEIAKDGSSIKDAIKVKSVTEEYAYVRNNCDDCKLLGQALLFENGKPYDRINVKNKEGKEISYYFDISSFFGKF